MNFRFYHQRTGIIPFKKREIGEFGAHEKLKRFAKTGIKNYKEGRNFPADPYVSRLSPHLHWGEISPNQAWYAVEQSASEKNVDHFRSELGWREFSAYLLHHNPTQQSNLKANLTTSLGRRPSASSVLAKRRDRNSYRRCWYA